jgi:AcrR family transcriptional regulator
MKQPRPDILDAAVKIAIAQGVLAVTIDSVAQAVGLTKAGLLYHYPSKDALLSAMLSHIGKILEQSVETEAASDPNPNRRWIRALLRVVMRQTGDPVKAFMVMLTVSINNPALMKPVQAQVRSMMKRILKQPDGESELIAWLAVDGLLLWQHLGILDADSKIAKKLLRHLLGSLGVPSRVTISRPPRRSQANNSRK